MFKHIYNSNGVCIYCKAIRSIDNPDSANCTLDHLGSIDRQRLYRAIEISRQFSTKDLEALIWAHTQGLL